MFLALLQICLVSGALDFRIVHQNSTHSTSECSYNERVERYPIIRVNHNGKQIRETVNSTKITLKTDTPQCGKESHFSCVASYGNQYNEKPLTLLPSHDQLTIDTGENRSACLPTNKMVTIGCLVNNLCTKENVSFVESPNYSVISQVRFFDETTTTGGERRYFGIAVASMTFPRGGKVNVKCRAMSGQSTSKQIDVFDCESNMLDDKQLITIDTNVMSHLTVDKTVTIWCRVKNLHRKEKIRIEGDNFHQPEEVDVFYQETTSAGGRKSYLAVAAARGTFSEEGISNLICSTERAGSATKAVTVERNEETQSNGVHKVSIHINALHRVYANQTANVSCTVMTMISKDKVWFDGNNFYQLQEPDIKYFETTAGAGKERYVAIAEAQVVFVKMGDFNLTCITPSGGSATKPITVLDPVPRNKVDQSGQPSNLSKVAISLGAVVLVVLLVVLIYIFMQRKKDLRCPVDFGPFVRLFNRCQCGEGQHQGKSSPQERIPLEDETEKPGDQNMKNDGADGASGSQENGSRHETKQSGSKDSKSLGPESFLDLKTDEEEQSNHSQEPLTTPERELQGFVLREAIQETNEEGRAIIPNLSL